MVTYQPPFKSLLLQAPASAVAKHPGPQARQESRHSGDKIAMFKRSMYSRTETGLLRRPAAASFRCCAKACLQFRAIEGRKARPIPEHCLFAAAFSSSMQSQVQQATENDFVTKNFESAHMLPQ